MFLKKIDSIGSVRQSGYGTSEVQRTFLELLNQPVRFKEGAKVKIVLPTNRPDALDNALLRERQNHDTQKPFELATSKIVLKLENKNASKKIISSDESFVCSDININFLTNNEASVCFYFVRR